MFGWLCQKEKDYIIAERGKDGQKKCGVLYEHTIVGDFYFKLARTFKETVAPSGLSFSFEIDFLRKRQLLLEQYKIRPDVKD